MPTTVAVVPAAGAGLRLGAGRPKAFFLLGGQTLVERAVATLRSSGVIDQVVVAVPPGFTDEATLILGESATVVAGGADRAESVRLALASAGEPDFVLVHDAARALTPPHLVVRVVEALRAGHRAVVPALAVTDTIKAVDANGTVLGTPERAGLRAVQTPQGFAAELLLRAYQQAPEGVQFTDDSSLAEHIGAQVHVVEGDPLAFKITTPLDAVLAKAVVSQ